MGDGEYRQKIEYFATARTGLGEITSVPRDSFFDAVRDAHSFVSSGGEENEVGVSVRAPHLKDSTYRPWREISILLSFA